MSILDIFKEIHKHTKTPSLQQVEVMPNPKGKQPKMTSDKSDHTTSTRGLSPASQNFFDMLSTQEPKLFQHPPSSMSSNSSSSTLQHEYEQGKLKVDASVLEEVIAANAKDPNFKPQGLLVVVDETDSVKFLGTPAELIDVISESETTPIASLSPGSPDLLAELRSIDAYYQTRQEYRRNNPSSKEDDYGDENYEKWLAHHQPRRTFCEQDSPARSYLRGLHTEHLEEGPRAQLEEEEFELKSVSEAGSLVEVEFEGPAFKFNPDLIVSAESQELDNLDIQQLEASYSAEALEEYARTMEQDISEGTFSPYIKVEEEAGVVDDFELVGGVTCEEEKSAAGVPQLSSPFTPKEYVHVEDPFDSDDEASGYTSDEVEEPAHVAHNVEEASMPVNTEEPAEVRNVNVNEGSAPVNYAVILADLIDPNETVRGIPIVALLKALFDDVQAERDIMSNVADVERRISQIERQRQSAPQISRAEYENLTKELKKVIWRLDAFENRLEDVHFQGRQMYHRLNGHRIRLEDADQRDEQMSELMALHREDSAEIFRRLGEVEYSAEKFDETRHRLYLLQRKVADIERFPLNQQAMNNVTTHIERLAIHMGDNERNASRARLSAEVDAIRAQLETRLGEMYRRDEMQDEILQLNIRLQQYEDRRYIQNDLFNRRLSRIEQHLGDDIAPPNQQGHDGPPQDMSDRLARIEAALALQDAIDIANRAVADANNYTQPQNPHFPPRPEVAPKAEDEEDDYVLANRTTTPTFTVYN